MRKVLFASLLGLIAAGAASPSALAQGDASPAPAASAAPMIEIAGPVLMVTDLERSLRFYVEGLGLEAVSRLPAHGRAGPGAVLASPAHPRVPFVLLRQTSVDPARSPAIEHGNALSRVMVTVPDAGAAAARLRAAGFVPDAPGTQGIFFATDPDGYRYEIMPQTARH